MQLLDGALLLLVGVALVGIVRGPAATGALAVEAVFAIVLWVSTAMGLTLTHELVPLAMGCVGLAWALSSRRELALGVGTVLEAPWTLARTFEGQKSQTRRIAERLITSMEDAVRVLLKEGKDAFVVIERDNDLSGSWVGGVDLDALATAQMLFGLFAYPGQLPPGPVLIRKGRIKRSGGALPRIDLEGTRFSGAILAALGVSKCSDALAVVVEANQICLVERARIVRMAGPEQLSRALHASLEPSDTRAQERRPAR